MDLTEDVRGRLADAQRRLRSAGGKVRWTQPENLHVTLKFLGDVPDKLAGQVCRAAEEVAGSVERFAFDVRGVTAVPPRGALRMFWAGVNDPAGGMAALVAGLDEAMQPLGFAPERRAFRPHVTLGRVKSGRDVDALRAAAEEWADAAFGEGEAGVVTVYSSELTPDGPVYAPLARPALSKGGRPPGRR